MSFSEVKILGRIIYDPFTSHSDESKDGGAGGTCAVCSKICKRKYCSVACYRTFQRSGSIVDRFWAKVQRGAPDACWVWKGRRTTFGHGQLSQQAEPGRTVPIYAHRLSWELHHGPTDRWVLHRCDNPPCVNPAHLFLGDHAANMQDASSKGRLNVPRPSRRKISDEQLCEMRSLIAGGMKQVEAARRFAVSEAYVSRVLRGTLRQYSPDVAREGAA